MAVPNIGKEILKGLPVRKLKRRWTEDEDRRLLTMVAEKRARRLIAASLRRTEVSVHNRLSILRASMDIPSTERDKQSAHDGPRSYGVHEARVPRP
jgi:hypothetical protein